MINLDAVPIRHPFVQDFAAASIPLPGGGFLSSSAIVMLISLVAAIFIGHFTRFGANIYAVGGDRSSATLMGVPMRRTTVGIYALGGFYSALGGVIYALYTSSGYPLAGTGNELTAIASVVLGGTLLTGGVGMVAGTLFGGMILGLIATLINFNGSLNGCALDHDRWRRAAVLASLSFCSASSSARSGWRSAARNERAGPQWRAQPEPTAKQQIAQAPSRRARAASDRLARERPRSS